MNKKFINLLLASVLTAGSVQVFTSCKDNEADFQAQYKYDYESLEGKIAANTKLINTVKGDLEAAITALRGDLNTTKATLEQQIRDLNTQLTQKITDQGLRIDQLDQKLADYIIKNDANLNNLQQQITSNFNKITNLEADLTILEGRVATLEAAQAVLEGRVDTLDSLAAGLRVDVDQLRSDLDALSATVGNLSNTVTDQGARLVIVETTLASVQSALGQLTTDFNSYKTATDGRLEALETFKTTWESILPQVQQNAIDALNKAIANEASIEAINSTIEELKAKDSELEGKYNAQQLLIDQILEKLDDFVTKTTFDEAIEELKAKDAELEALAMANYRKSIGYTNLMIEQVLEQMRNNDSELKREIQAQIDGLNGAIEGINGEIGKLNGEIVNIKLFQAGLETKIKKNAEEISRLDGEIAKVNGEVVKLQDAINAVNNRIDAIDGRITSIVLQGTEDRVFGSLRLPIGIQSNLLISYFGESIEGVNFPLVGEGAGSYNGDESNALTVAEADKLGVKPQLYQGLYMPEANDGNGLLGYVYATINPSSVDVQNPKFEYNLVNSRGERLVEPMHFVPSDKELTFGYSRAGNDNGFYVAEASVKVDEESLNKIRFHFNDNLKTTVKDILKAPRANANKETVAKLANALYDQVNGFLPAIGVEASWIDDNNGQMKVTSNYGIATAVVNPLSFAFLYDYKPSKHIPHIMPALDKIKDKFQVAFDEIKDKITISLYDPENPFTIEWENKTWISWTDLEITGVSGNVQNPPVIIPTIEIDGNTYTGEPIVINIAGDINATIDNLVGELNRQLGQINASIGGINGDLNGAISGMIGDISGRVDELLQGMQTQVDKTVDGLLADIENKVNGALNNSTVNRLVNRLDGIISKLNDIMDNANYYLQPVLLYNNNGDFGMVSTSKTMPSVMVLTNGGNAITLKPTTYTYETVVPTFKKYVAVTKVWKNGDKNENNVIDVYDEANNLTGNNLGMNKVFGGADRQIILKLQKGYTYELMYQALDYSGYVSGRKYYICVK